ncbi:MAG TPA: PfkB family carbohydrate kinase [Candidatus Acidoferrales bacterium]|nr:PfkB family carbohydrate kinase [Candidatus Acidoferrales bacterium]
MITAAVETKGNSKILPLQDLARVVAELQEAGKVVVQCHGVFDLMHIGHIRHFESAKKLGDVLIVTVTPDRYVNKGPNRPVFTEAHRAASIGALACVDYVAINQWPMATDTIRLLRPNIFAKGSEYRDASKDRTGAISAEEQVIEEIGGRLAFTDDVVFSSSTLLNHHFGIFPERTEQFLARFSAEHNARETIRWLEEARGLKVLVLGEAIIDEYQYCETIGKSGKEPVLVARHMTTERFPGGIVAVANHAAAISEQVTMLTCLGRMDSHEDFIVNQTKPKVEKLFHYLDEAPTIIKRRFVENYPLQKLFEVYVMGDIDQHAAQSAAIREHLAAILPRFDAVIVADYGHGMMTPEVIWTVCQHARFLAVNTQVNAGNHGFNTVSKYARADYISISERELRLEARRPRGELDEIVVEVANRLSCERMMITRGDKGCLCYSRQEGFVEVPAFTGRVVDRVGAGDAVLAVTALCAARQAPMEITGFIGSCVGAMAVAVVGNRDSVEGVPLQRYIECILK